MADFRPHNGEMKMNNTSRVTERGRGGSANAKGRMKE
jgi:hypothetical protein